MFMFTQLVQVKLFKLIAYAVLNISVSISELKIRDYKTLIETFKTLIKTAIECMCFPHSHEANS
jgi:hypothetical protein